MQKNRSVVCAAQPNGKVATVHIVINASAVSNVKGGASFYIVNAVRAIAAATTTHTMVILCTRSGASSFAEVNQKVRCLAIAPKNALMRLLWEQCCLPFICLFLRADLLFSPNYTMPVISLGYKNVVTIHDLSFFPLSNLYPKSRRLFRTIIQLSAKCANAIIAVSECTKRDIGHYVTTRAAEKTTVVYNAVDERFTEATTASLPAGGPPQFASHPYILFTGFLEPRKNLVRLITAFGRICSRIPHDLVIAGGNGWWYEKLPDTVISSGVKERVRFLGYVPDKDMPALYRQAALFAFPSLYEGFGIAALEAITCGTPVLASNNTSLPEVVGDAGIYVDPYNIDDIAQKLELVADEALMQTLRGRCRSVAERFSWHTAAEKTISLFESVCPPKTHR